MTKKWFIARVPFTEPRIPMVELLLLVAPVFGLVALGYGAALAGLIGERANEGLTSYLFVIGAPALMFKLLTAAVFPGVFPWGYWIAYYAGMAIVWGLATVLAAGLFRRSRGDAVIAGLATGQANTVLIGIPIILKAYGEEAAFPIAMLLAVNLPITMTLATLMLEGTRAATGGALFVKLGRGLATHPLIIAMAAGVAFQVFGLRPSGVAATMLDMVANTTIPLSLIALGLSLKTYGVRTDVPVALMICVLRLLVHPAIAYVVAHHVFALPPSWTGTVVLFAAMPAGINAYLFAARYGQGVGIASTAVALSTLLAAVTSLLWLRVLGIG
ncbi:MAG: AEC family transporter [Phreatobacter sp.]|uniref:AEC family transporter n=1 Tax=Phreatobacter sp. TaxID=1966341 RepID=UPI002735D713|nr:AEC family transporter [Phreatobacter sp.]MDP2803188.1 AEC family transporter [Phreatobacter sp.]